MTPHEGTACVIYCRVSTREQGDSGLGLAAQEEACRTEAARRGWHIERVFREVISGAKGQRPEFDEACELAAHHGGVLLAAKADRISRGSVTSVLDLHERAHREGWHVYTCDMPEIDTTSPMGEFLLTILAAINRLERRMIGQRTKEAMAQAKKRGTKTGNPIGRPGVLDERTREKEPEVYERMVRALRIIRPMRAGGVAYRTIAATLNEQDVPGPRGGRWTDMTVIKALRKYGMGDDKEKAA